MQGMGTIGPFCIKNGEFDQWNSAFDMTAPKGQVPEGQPQKVSAQYKVDVTSAGLMHQVSYNVEVQGVPKMEFSLPVIGSATPNGPTEDDLDIAKWPYEICKKTNP